MLTFHTSHESRIPARCPAELRGSVYYLHKARSWRPVGWGGGGGDYGKFNTGRLRPEVRPLTLLDTIFGRKDTLFVYLPLDYSIPFTYKLNQYSHKICVRNILMKGPFKYLNDRFPYPFIYFDSCNPFPFMYLRREKVPLSGRASPYTLLAKNFGRKLFRKIDTISENSVRK